MKRKSRGFYRVPELSAQSTHETQMNPEVFTVPRADFRNPKQGCANRQTPNGAQILPREFFPGKKHVRAQPSSPTRAKRPTLVIIQQLVYRESGFPGRIPATPGFLKVDEDSGPPERKKMREKKVRRR